VDKRRGEIIERQIGDKQMAIRPLPEGGTFRETITGPARHEAVLSEAQVVELAQLGSRIENHYGRPQDIEWCLDEGRFYIVQSRPITTLYPLPEPRPTDDAFRIYFSLSHAQVMTDAMPPMGTSIWRLLFSIGKASRPLDENPYLCPSGGRLYVDLTPILHARLPRRLVPRVLTVADPLSAQIIGELIQRPEFDARPPHEKGSSWDLLRWLLPLLRQAMLNLWWRKPEGTTERLNQSIAQQTADVRAKLAAAEPGVERLMLARQIAGDALIQNALPIAPYVMSGILTQRLLLGIAKREGLAVEAEATMRGLQGNVTTEMDLAVGDLADAARQSPELVRLLQNGEMEAALETAASDPAAQPFHQALEKFLHQYGMRGPSEIDITRARWNDDPGSLLRMAAGNLGRPEAGTHRQHHRQMAQAGEAAAERLIAAVRQRRFGSLKARLVRRLVRVSRNHAPAREHPKFLLIQLLGLVRSVILEAAELLHNQNRLNAIEDVWFLTLPELIEMFEDTAVDPGPLITQRRADMTHYQKLSPPRIITGDGEIPTAQHTRDDIPAAALAGSAVSGGIVEGIARVVLDPTKETLQAGEILVAPFTDPGWTPLFINAAGLVMEVGGLMTHGSVIAREYGIPAVVAVPEATKRIQTGQRLRVNGDGGYVELL
jgi:pyruvate,water dikinase